MLIEANESPTSEEGKARLISAIWSSIEQANLESPAHARILKDHIIFTSPAKPIPRAAKGSIQRKLAIKLYATEFESLYNSSGEEEVQQSYSSVQWNHENLQKDILRTVTTVLGLKNIGPKTNFFEHGFDSLHVMALSKHIKSLLAESKERPTSFTSSTIYNNPSAESLATALTVSADTRESLQTPAEMMKSLYASLVHALPINARKPIEVPRTDYVVLLTGSTGSLGSYVLDRLIRVPKISRIYCMNRGDHGLERQTSSFAEKNLNPDFSRVKFLVSQYSKPYLGLDVDVYKQLLQEVTHIIHNAWQVDFNVSLDHLSPHVHFVRQLIAFSSSSDRGSSIFFISSIGTVSRWNSTQNPSTNDKVPEQLFTDWNIPEYISYAQSKFVSERLLATASTVSEIPISICRVGQIAGPTTISGHWSPKEWFPSLVRSSKSLGKLPSSLGRVDHVDWLPVDILAHVIIELLDPPIENATHTSSETFTNTSRNKSRLNIYHAANPHVVPFSSSSLLPVIQAHLQLEAIPYSEWLSLLRASVEETKDAALNPAIKLLDTFEKWDGTAEGQTLLDTTETMERSRTLRGMREVDGKWMERWLRQWGM